MKCIYISSFSLQMLFETFLIISTNRDTITNVYWSSCKIPVILVGVIKLKLLQHIFENTESSFIKIRPVVAPSSSMRMDGRTYITKLIFAFCNFANAPY